MKNTKRITIDSRKCGDGKTTAYTIPSALRYVEFDKNVLISAPSVASQNMFTKAFTNSEYFDTYAEINHKKNESVSKQLIRSYLSEQVQCITHQCFLMTDVSSMKYDKVFIDESFNPLKITPIFFSEKANSANPGFNYWDDFFSYPNFSNTEMVELTLKDVSSVRSAYDTSIFNLSTNKNYRHFLTKKSYDRIKTMTADDKRPALIFSIFDVRLLNKMNIHISAAAFHKTFLALLMKIEDIEHSVLDTCEFVKHNKNKVKVYHGVYADYSAYNHSKKNAVKHPEYLMTFRNKVSQTVGDRLILNLANKDDVTKNDFRFINQKDLQHNAAGLNDYAEAKDICLTSAINYSPEQKFFFNQIGISDDDLLHAFTAYDFYQNASRTAIRDRDYTGEVNLYILDSKVAFAMSEYFEDIEFIPVVISDEVIEKKVAMTQQERNKKYRDKLKADKPKKVAMTAAERVKKHREKKKLQAA